jgi:hypothetical protein
MKKLSAIILLGLGFGLGVVVLLFIPGKHVAAQAIPSVNVANTPLSVQGTVTANISGTPTISARQSGGWNVGIVRDLENPARQPFQTQVALQTFDTATGAVFSLTRPIVTVPAGKELVIEMVTANVEIQTAFANNPNFSFGGKVRYFELGSTGGGVSVTNYFAPTMMGPNEFGFSNFAFSQPTRIYADPQTTVSMTVGALGHIDLTISGHLVQLEGSL